MSDQIEAAAESIGVRINRESFEKHQRMLRAENAANVNAVIEAAAKEISDAVCVPNNDSSYAWVFNILKKHFTPSPATADQQHADTAQTAGERIIGRPDKPFHKAECQCQQCLDWIAANPQPAPAEAEDDDNELFDEAWLESIGFVNSWDIGYLSKRRCIGISPIWAYPQCGNLDWHWAIGVPSKDLGRLSPQVCISPPRTRGEVRLLLLHWRTTANAQVQARVAELEGERPKVEQVVAVLADHGRWNWTQAISRRDAANEVLALMVNAGLIEGRQHPSVWGGTGFSVYRVNGRLYGRTDGVDDSLFVPAAAEDRA